MCCFSRPVEHVSATKIFARALDGGLQHLVYSMNFAAAGDLAMILPLPVPPKPPEDAVTFVDLEGYAHFFDDMKKAFPLMMMAPLARGGLLSNVVASQTPLVVHDVGLFEASFVPTLADFDRLDERFRLSPGVWDALPQYRDWGFAVFKLKQKAPGFLGRVLGRAGGPQTVHPMAFTFPRRDPASIFFPTVHVHDGEVHDTASFDHTLYCQPDELVAETFGWEESEPIGKFVDAERARGVVDGARPCFRSVLVGPLPNIDTELLPPSCARSSLHRTGRCFELRIHARSAYYTRPRDERAARQRETARHHIDALSAHLESGVETLVRDNADAWHLCPYDPSLLDCSFNTNEVFGRMLSQDSRGYMTQPIPETGPIRVLFVLSNDRVESQFLWLSFADVPEPRRLAGIKARLDALLESAPLGGG
jgi:hypothetical protein